MALSGVRITIGQSLGGGRYASSIKGASAPDIATILTDITAALAVSAISGDPTSTTAVTLVQTDATALTGALNNDITVIWNTTNVTHRNQLRHALQTAIKAVEAGYGGLAE